MERGLCLIMCVDKPKPPKNICTIPQAASLNSVGERGFLCTGILKAWGEGGGGGSFKLGILEAWGVFQF